MSKNKIASILVILMLFPLLIGTFQYAHGKEKLYGSEVKLGLLLPSTGWATSYGKECTVAINMAVEEINASGGIGGLPLRLIIGDTASKGEEAIKLVRKLSEKDDVLAIMGPYLSNECNIAFPVANQLEVPIVSMAAVAPGISARNRPFTFRNTLTADKATEPALKKFIALYNIKTVGIIYDSKDFMSKSDAETVYPPLLEKYGIQVIEKATFQTGDVDFSSQVNKIQAAKPDGIIVSTLIEGAYVVREIRARGMKQPIMTGVGLAVSEFLKVAGSGAEGVIQPTCFWRQNPDPKVQKFVNEYVKRYGAPPDHTNVQAYDIVYIMKKLIEESGVTNKPEDLKKDRVFIRDGWQNLKNYRGIQGVTSIDQNGDGIKETYIIQIKEGKFTRIF